jgi:hypothetical protein
MASKLVKQYYQSNLFIMKITKIFLISTLPIISFFVSLNFAQAEEITGSVTVIVGAPTATVDVKVSPVGGTKVDGPITLNTGSNVEVEWTTNPSVTSCTCTCRNPDTNVAINCGSGTTTSCGTGIGVPKESTPYPIPNVTKPTKFDVNCEP